LSDLIEHEVNGFEIDLEENALFYELENLYENYRSFEIVRRNATKSVSKHSIQAVAENYLKLYERMLND
jgi:glycosyltransferase involved in cell wall biosynthesis